MIDLLPINTNLFCFDSQLREYFSILKFFLSSFCFCRGFHSFVVVVVVVPILRHEFNCFDNSHLLFILCVSLVQLLCFLFTPLCEWHSAFRIQHLAFSWVCPMPIVLCIYTFHSINDSYTRAVRAELGIRDILSLQIYRIPYIFDCIYLITRICLATFHLALVVELCSALLGIGIVFKSFWFEHFIVVLLPVYSLFK